MLTNRSFPPQTFFAKNRAASSRRSFLQACSLAALSGALFSACSAEPVGGSDAYIVQADTTPDGGFFVRLPNGQTFTDRSVFLSEAPAELKKAHDAGQRLEIQLGALASVDIAGTMEATAHERTSGSGELAQRQSALYREVGGLVITGDWSWGYVSGCVKHTAIQYVFRCEDKFIGLQYVDLRLSFWRQGTQLCVGIYESVRQLANTCSCDQGTFNRIYQELVDLLGRARITPATAAVIAALLTAATYAILVLV